MSFFAAIIVGVVQGLTEFLPISSSGHLVIVQKLLGIEQHDLALDLAAHMGTVLSIVTIYYGLLGRLLRALGRVREWFKTQSVEMHLIKMVILGSVPTALIGLAFKDQFEEMFSDMTSLGVCFILTGLMLLLSKLKGGARFDREDLVSLKGIESLTWWKAILIGTAQGLAIAPSISRSGATIVAALLLGILGPTAAMFSFILSLPAIVGAAVLELKDVPLEASRWEILGAGFLTAYLFGLLGLWLTLLVVKKGRLEIFTFYLVALGVFILATWV